MRNKYTKRHDFLICAYKHDSMIYDHDKSDTEDTKVGGCKNYKDGGAFLTCYIYKYNIFKILLFFF